MKIDLKAATVTSNIPRDNTTRMAIDADGMEHIMSLLTNLYKDPETAVIREYYTNARDAHIEAGVNKPVKVKLPTWDDPTYVVQDFGVGMSEWDIKNVYSQYGASTKRNTDLQAGAFGLGCKSAFAIATQFTVISVKGGMKCTTLFSMVVNGTYESTVVSNVPTTEGNGTIVKIPIDTAPYTFNDKAKKFFQFSKPGLVLVDGVEPVYALDTAQKLDNPNDPDMMLHLKAKADGESFVIMGDTPYALSNTEIESSLARLGVSASRGFVRMPKYFTVPIGSVDLSPAREGLRFTDKTNATVDAHLSFIVNDLRGIAIKEINDSKTLEEIFEAHKRWNDIVSVPREFNGKAVPGEIKLDESARTITRSSWGSSSHSEAAWLRIDRPDERIIVKGYGADQYKKINGYLTPYMTAKGMSHGSFVVTNAKNLFTDEWIAMSKNFTFVDGADIIDVGREQRKKERQAASKTNGTATKSKITYPVLFVDDEEVRWVAHDELAEGTPYLQSTQFTGGISEMIRATYRNSGYDRNTGSELSKFIETITDEKEIILIGNSRTIKALEQRVKNTRNLREDVDTKFKTLSTLLTPEVVKHHAVAQSSWARFLKSTGIDKMIKDVADPEIIEIISPDQAVIDSYKTYEDTKVALKYFDHNGMPMIPQIPYTQINKAVETLDKKYPLVNSLNTWSLDKSGVKHIVKYFNMIHEEHQVKKPLVMHFNVNV